MARVCRARSYVALSTRAQADGFAARISGRSSVPEPSGNPRSRITTSALANSSRASASEAACPTIWKSGCGSNSDAIASRMGAWSSTSRTRTGLDVSDVSIGQVSLEPDGGPAPRLAPYLETSAEQLGPLAHPRNAVVHRGRHAAGIKPQTVVRDLGPELALLGRHPHYDVAGIGMSASIGQCLSHDLHQLDAVGSERAGGCALPNL